MGETHQAGKLRIESHPFDAGDGNGRLGRPLQQALGEVIRQIGLETPVVVVPGSTGTGKTLLANMAERVCSDMGLSIRRIHRGEFVDVADGQRSDVLLVDEADSMPDSTLHMLLFEGDKRPATTTVLLCLPASIRRFTTAGDVVVVELTRLSQSDTRHYLQERATQAGFPDLFTPAAFDLIVDGSRGVPRSLWSIAGLAYFYAAAAGATQIGREHVARALASQIAHPEKPEVAVPTAPVLRLVTETPVANPAAPPVATPPHGSGNVAVFKRDSAEPPISRSKPSEAPVRAHSAAVMPTIGTEIKPLDPIPWPMSDLQKSIASTLNSSALDDELPAGNHEVKSPKTAQPGSIGFVRARAGSGTRRSLSVIVASAAGLFIGVAATAALTIFFQPTSRNETAAVATSAEKIGVRMPTIANRPSITPAKLPEAAGQGNQDGAANTTAHLSNPPKSATTQSSIALKVAPTKAAQPTRRTTASPAVAPSAPTTTAVPLEANTPTAGPVQVAADTANPTNSAEADAASASARVAAQQQTKDDRMARDVAAQAQAKAIRKAKAKEAADRANAAIRAANARTRVQADKAALLLIR